MALEREVAMNENPDTRRQRAAEALAALGMHRSDHQRLSVQCARSHHLAGVYETDAGLVYAAIEGPHAHGSRDRVDTAHHGGPRGTEYADMLAGDAMSDDGLPAWCDCGSHTLSRAGLLSEVESGSRTVHIP
ncbi:MAG: hypothetical protein R2720_10785 [Candidatus Nanopelagicales bacterium]